MSDAMKISRSGLDVEWQRLQVIAQNLANLNTSRTASGEPYRPMRLVSGPEGVTSSVRAYDVEEMSAGVRRDYDPTDPHADAQGFVSRPMIDHAGEMTLLIRTSRAYEANLTALGIEHQMTMRALDLGGGR